MRQYTTKFLQGVLLETESFLKNPFLQWLGFHLKILRTETWKKNFLRWIFFFFEKTSIFETIQYLMDHPVGLSPKCFKVYLSHIILPVFLRFTYEIFYTEMMKYIFLWKKKSYLKTYFSDPKYISSSPEYKPQRIKGIPI